jgi:D-alanyl-D-alanine carboxypeptidase
MAAAAAGRTPGRMARIPAFLALVLVLMVAAGCGGGQGQRPELQGVLDGLVSGPSMAGPGATAYVAGPHGTWNGAAGLANVRTGERMQPDARMRLESVSKLWTATLILQLVGEGRLRLDDTVEQRLPGLLPYGDRITIRELLNHTSGLVDNNDITRDPASYIKLVKDPALRTQLISISRRIQADPGTTFSPLMWIRLAAWIPLLSDPNTQYHYSNIGYEILGLIAARTSGEPLAALYRDRIAKPLGLNSVAYDPQGDIAGPHPVGYRVDAKGKPVAATAWGTGGVGAEGGIVASAQDEARFLVALMQGKLLKPTQLSAMKTVAPAAAGGLYGFGTGVDPSGCAGTAYGHNGAGAAFSTSVFVSGDGKRVAVLLLNGRSADGSSDVAVHAAMNELYCKA